MNQCFLAKKNRVGGEMASLQRWEYLALSDAIELIDEDCGQL